MKVALRGHGVAAACCAHLLGKAGIDVSLETAARRGVPALMVSDQALALMRDVLGRPTLFAGKPRIERRIVAWGGQDPVSLPHGAVMIAESDFADMLPARPPALATGEPDVTIHAAPPFPAATLRRFGKRQALAARVMLRESSDRSACWIEAVRSGWLFLVPAGGDAGWLLAIGAPAAALLGESRHIAPRIELTDDAPAAFDACPHILEQLCGADWLACGSGAIAFDPICGDGTAQAIRIAILASAVLVAEAEGEDPAMLRSHYQAMLIAAMRRHLQLCADFYRSGGDGPWWDAQLAALASGHDWCTAKLAVMPEPRYMLRDFRLVAREIAA